MKILYTDGDRVFYEKEHCKVVGEPCVLNNVEGIHIRKENGDIVLAPLTAVKSMDAWLLDECIGVIDAYERLEYHLITDEEDSLLESMSTKNYNTLLAIQEMRNSLAQLMKTIKEAPTSASLQN